MNKNKGSFYQICQKGMDLFKSKSLYAQNTVYQKLVQLGIDFGKTTFNKILNNRDVGQRSLRIAAETMQSAIKKELGYVWRDEEFIKLDDTDFQVEIIPTRQRTGVSLNLKFHENRLSLQEKIKFLKFAKHEIIEFGLTLRKFTSSLCSGSNNDFKLHIEELLSHGINFKCYLLNPHSNFGNQYFNDRAAVIPDEADYTSSIKSNIKRLQWVQNEFLNKGYAGSFQIYTYLHIPYNNFLIIDPYKPHSQIMASHYMYGIPRGDSPVIQFAKQHQPTLYQTYIKSFELMSKGAKLVPPTM